MIDWNRVSELRNEVGADDFNEVVELFLMEVSSEIARLRSAVNYDTLEDDLHFLKGSALNLGFAIFAVQCAEGEALAAAGCEKSVNTARIVKAFEMSKDMFMQELNVQIAA